MSRKRKQKREELQRQYAEKVATDQHGAIWEVWMKFSLIMRWLARAIGQAIHALYKAIADSKSVYHASLRKPRRAAKSKRCAGKLLPKRTKLHAALVVRVTKKRPFMRPTKTSIDLVSGKGWIER